VIPEETILNIRRELEKARTEEDVKMRIAPFLDRKAKELGLEMASYEHSLEISGKRIDALYSKVIIEYKSPGYLTDLRFHEAVDQVTEYIQSLSEQSGLNLSLYFSAIIDGMKIGFVRYSETEGRWIKIRPQEFTDITFSRIMNALRGLGRKELTANNIVGDFGPNSDLAKEVLSAFYEAEFKSQRAVVLENEWFETFKQIVSYKSTSMGELTKYYGIDAKSEGEFKKLLFSVQTYFALVMKLIVAEVMSNYSQGKLSGSYLLKLREAEDLKNELTDLEDEGGFFQKIMQVRNFLEGNYFSWYIDEWNDQIEKSIRRIIERLTDYESATADLKPERIRDLFKTLYQNLIPKKLRHDFGEYYTPDWLAELLMTEAGITKDENIMSKRFLDPACGSGTFLINIIKHFKIKLEEQSLDRREVVSNVLKNVVGYDLNPLAVLASRANFIVAMGDLIRERKGEVEIPVYLADSVGLRIHSDLSDEGVAKYYVLKSVVGEFKIPETLILAGRFIELLNILKKSLEINENVENFNKKLKQNLGEIEVNEERSLSMIYQKLLELEREGKNRVWVGLLRNTFAPILKGKFDYVIGNPPWINWETLPEDYRGETADLWDYYGLTLSRNKRRGKQEEVELGSSPEENISGRLGQVKRDLSMMFIAVSVERYLSDTGTLAMLCPYTLFKVTAGSGFRSMLAGESLPSPSSVPFRVSKIIDLVEMKPFEDSTTRTAALVLKKGLKTEFPIETEMWRPNKPIKVHYDLYKVMKKSRTFRMKFYPMSEFDVRTPWFMLTEKAFKGINKAIGESDYKAHEGVNTGLNGAYWVEVIEKRDELSFVRNLYDIGKIKVPKLEEWIEDDLVFPLVRGRDIKDFVATPSGSIILPHDINGKCLEEDKMKGFYPNAYSFFLRLKSQLTNRSIYKLWGKYGLFYALFDISDYSLSKYKVAFPHVSGRVSGKAEFKAGLIEPTSEKIVIPDKSCIFIPTDDYEEALYLLGILNSSIARLIVSSYSIETHIAPDIMNVIRVKRYDRNNEKHRIIIKLVGKIRREVVLKNDVTELLSELNQQVANLYDISEEELDEIGKDLDLLLNTQEAIESDENLEE
jgi:SAM-dependent methyltransferase